MKNRLKFMIVFLIFGLSGCCEPELTDKYLLSEHEKSLVPFNSYQDLMYENENGQNIKSSTQPRIIELIAEFPDHHGESCGYWEYEKLHNFVNFTSSGFSIKLTLIALKGLTLFEINYGIPNSDNSENEYFTDILNPSSEQAINVNLNGVEFENVFVFNNNNLNENSKVELILFSSEGKGIELISFYDGTFLKLK